VPTIAGPSERKERRLVSGSIDISASIERFRRGGTGFPVGGDAWALGGLLIEAPPHVLRSGSKEASEANERCERSGSKDFSVLYDFA